MDNLEEKIDAAYNKRGNEYLFINKNNSFLPYAEGFKDSYNLVMQEMSELILNNDKSKNAEKWSEEIIEINSILPKETIELLNEMKKQEEKLKQIDNICDMVLDGATNWDEEQLEGFIKRIKNIINMRCKNG